MADDSLIQDLFDPARDIHRVIEKVITYSADQEDRLKTEISEYVVTDSIEDQIERLLTRIQAAMDSGAGNEIGVWVSGFYGSGKSSLTKYLGLALDDAVMVESRPFLHHLRDRLNRPTTKALLNTVSQRFPAAVVLLDLASEMVAGSSMEEVSTVLYYKVLQWAGYSQNLKVAALERKLKKDGRYEEFQALIQDSLDVAWADIQNDPLVVDSLLPGIAHQMYPKIFRSETSFSADTDEIVRFETTRVEEMIEIAREHSGKEHVLFIIDEVGQYVGSKSTLIINLDGLAKNLKEIGDGKVWVIGTAQQTLTEDDATFAINSPELFKLKDRFPIHIDLESSDIREICYRRLLGKAPGGEGVLGKLFDENGQALRHNTRLEDAKFYDSEFDRETFVKLYPFLPAHFDILLHLLGALAKSTGGIGLRSAIKVIQDILIDSSDGHVPVCERPVGWLATTVTLYDSLVKDIAQAFRSVHACVDKVATIRFPDSDIHGAVAKTIGVLQILENLPVTRRNVASLMHPGVASGGQQDEVEKAIDELLADDLVPLGEQEGTLRFFSEKLHDIEQERGKVELRTPDARRIFSESLTEVFSPLPTTRLNDHLTIKSGLKVQTGSAVASLAGDRESIQTYVEFADAGEYDATQGRIVEESRERSSQRSVFLVAPKQPGMDQQLAEIYRCQEIARRHRNDVDQEVRAYCAAQTDRAGTLAGELQAAMRRSLVRGSFVFRGQATAVETLDSKLLDAARKHLANVAKEVFDRNSEAPVRVEMAIAEKLLRLGNLSSVTAAIDPLGLIQIENGTPKVNTNHKALVSIRDHLETTGTAEGKRLTDHFTSAPFGWSQDTLRYLVTVLLLAGEIKLKVSGHEVTVNGQQAIEGLRSNQAFRSVGVSLRHERPPMEMLARAAGRLTELLGETVVPLEDAISKATTRHFPRFQQQYGPLAEKIDTLGLTGGETLRTASQEITSILQTDGSDAPERLGAEESALYEGLTWAKDVDTALQNGVEATIREIQVHRRTIEMLPKSGIPGSLQDDLAEALQRVGERLSQVDWHQHSADLSTTLTSVKSRVTEAAEEMQTAQAATIKDAHRELQGMAEWHEITQEEQSAVEGELDGLRVDASPDLAGLETLLNQEYVISSRVVELKKRIREFGEENRRKRLETEREKAKKEGNGSLKRSISVPASVLSASDLEVLIKQLRELHAELAIHSDIEVTITIGD